jgi:putative transposase
MRRTNVVKLVVDKETHEKLRELGIITAKCWNEVNWLRMQQFKKGERWTLPRLKREVYWRYKNVLKVNAQQVARKNAESWRSFFSLIEEKKGGKFAQVVQAKTSRATGGMRSGKYKLIIVIRNDRYEVDENKRVIHLKDFNLTLRFKGKLKWHGKRGRLEVIYNEARRSWYAHIPVEVENLAEAKGSFEGFCGLGHR